MIAHWLHSGPFNAGIHYYSISSRSGHNFEKPFLDLLRRLIDSIVHYVEGPPIHHPPIHLPQVERTNLLETIKMTWTLCL